MKIKVFNRKAFENYKTDEVHIAISITDPKSESVKLINAKNSLLDILELQFHDYDNIKWIDNEFKLKFFTDYHAKKILNFVIKYEHLVETFLIHCEAGISRSAGVAGALSVIYNKDDRKYFQSYLPNMLVYRTILEVYNNEYEG